PAVCSSFAELIDLYPTVASLCGLEVPERIQGEDISQMLDDPTHQVRDAAFCVNGRGFLLRDDDWAFIQYGEKGARGVELFDMRKDPLQYTNLAGNPQHGATVKRYQDLLARKLRDVRDNDLPKKAK
ncbi:MAG: iduronate-2-sulfatase, partial [Pirellulaceae bacterium]|nr:iduronate-2-sulfatase [Pirellulaceae bacterium]